MIDITKNAYNLLNNNQLDWSANNYAAVGGWGIKRLRVDQPHVT